MDPAKKQVYARILETRNNITGSKNVSNQINTVMTPKIMTSMNVTVPTFMQHPTAVLELQPNFNAISKTKIMGPIFAEWDQYLPNGTGICRMGLVFA